MRALVLGAAALIVSSALATAADDVMSGYYGNTLISTGGMAEVHTHYKADHTFDGQASSMLGSMNLKGSWMIDDKGQLCRTYETPPPGVSNPFCTPWAAHKVGDTWTATMGSQTRTLNLVQGIK